MKSKKDIEGKMGFNWSELHEYTADQVASFVRDNMFELEKHPMDYQDHYEYIRTLYIDYINQFGAGLEL